MTPVGFSTGALAYADFRRALAMLRDERIRSVELSALRITEWAPLLDALGTLDLSGFDYIALHLPSSMDEDEERIVAESLQNLPWRWPLVLHPDVIADFALWRRLGSQLCIENMDKRKPIGRTARELQWTFEQLPEARLCFDIGHAWQVDPSMTEAYTILKLYREKIAQIHVSEVNSRSRHDLLSYSTIQSFRSLASMIPSVPLILETPVSQDQMRSEMNKARFALLPVMIADAVGSASPLGIPAKVDA